MSIMHTIFYHIIKRSKAEFNPENPPDYKYKRKIEEDQVKRTPVARGVKIQKAEIAQIQVEYISQKANPQDRVIYYIHGGEFVSGSSLQRRNFTGYVAKNRGTMSYLWTMVWFLNVDSRQE